MKTRGEHLGVVLAVCAIGCTNPPPTHVASTPHPQATHTHEGSQARESSEKETPPTDATKPPTTDTAATPFVPIVREEQHVVVDGKSETWRLVWQSPPQVVCDNPEFTCPCIGFQYGERAKLDLVRVRAELPEERFPLSPFFADAENPATESGIQEAVLQRWPVLKDDSQKYTSGPPSNAEIANRPIVRVMNVGDYDHDGRATEFVLQIGTEPCGHSDTVLVGISKSQPTLHVFSTADNPNVPLITERPAWDALRKSSGTTHYTMLTCGDHGSEIEVELVLTADRAGLHMTTQSYECDANFHRGRSIATPEH